VDAWSETLPPDTPPSAIPEQTPTPLPQAAPPNEAPLDTWSETLAPATLSDDLPEQTPETAAPARSPALWIGLAALVLVIVVVGLWLFKQPASEVAEAELPAATIAEAPAAPPEEEAPPAATAEEETTTSLADQPAAEQAPIFNEAAAKDLIARLQAGPPPASCRAGIAKLRQENNLTANQASDIARRTWPELCSPPKPAAAAPAPPPEVVAPEPPAPVSKSIDQVYKERSASECAAGLSGFFCREGLRNKLCAGKWASRPPAGQSLCYLPEESR
jgi:hypothetical protein